MGIVLRTRSTKALLFLGAFIGGAMTADADIELARQRFANSKAINLEIEAQTQMITGDLQAAARTIDEAFRVDPTLWLTYFMRARLFVLQHKYELAIQDCNWVLAKYSRFVEAALFRAEANARLGRYADSLRELDHVVAIRPHLDSYARALRERAWFRSTCPDASFRDGQQAVRDAKIACKITKLADASMIDTLAVAYAAAGDFASAIRYGEQTLSVKGITPHDSRLVQQHLALFKQRRPVRIPAT
jgi:tetratricopeptide (TPR) repeat protein